MHSGTHYTQYIEHNIRDYYRPYIPVHNGTLNAHKAQCKTVYNNTKNVQELTLSTDFTQNIYTTTCKYKDTTYRHTECSAYIQ